MNYLQACKHDEWITAMQNELISLENNNNWEITHLHEKSHWF